MPLRLIRHAPRLSALRAYHATPPRGLPYKDSQDRESLKPQSAENTKSGRDNDAAAASEAAFGRRVTSPEKERQKAAQEGSDPLEVSGANQELSKPQGDERTGKTVGAGKEVRKGGRSGGGAAEERRTRMGDL